MIGGNSTYEVHLLDLKDHRYGKSLREYLVRHVARGGGLPPAIGVPRGYEAEARRALADVPGGDGVEVRGIGGCLAREVWFLVEEEAAEE